MSITKAEKVEIAPGQVAEFPLDLIAPAYDKEYKSFIWKHDLGKLEEVSNEDYVIVPMQDIMFPSVVQQQIVKTLDDMGLEIRYRDGFVNPIQDGKQGFAVLAAYPKNHEFTVTPHTSGYLRESNEAKKEIEYITEEKFAMFFINRFVHKLLSIGYSPKEVQQCLFKLQIFQDPVLQKQRRYGIYGWIDLNEAKCGEVPIYKDEHYKEIGFAIDWKISSDLMSDLEIMVYAIIYAKRLAQNGLKTMVAVNEKEVGL